ncbi:MULTISPECIES: hypothetical protein [Thermomonosporaceae]|uniref:hypothetical protein n=1 Tax=Thermomonosporaceae TaxID=2012 RepID=UPI00255B3B7E|nr:MULTISPECIES: hypothetical protein [Thermomonosporaceae]MDL4775574.1 hypothetical protein [Actinomadura xylanilytica]
MTPPPGHGPRPPIVGPERHRDVLRPTITGATFGTTASGCGSLFVPVQLAITP